MSACSGVPPGHPTSKPRDTTSTRPWLTAKGERVRARIVEAAATLIHERGVVATTLDDVKAAAGVSGSQLYHFFPDKSELLHAVIGYQADTIVNAQRQVLLSGPRWVGSVAHAAC